MADKYFFSLIIPCFNEEKRLQKRFPKTFNFLRENFKNFEIIFIDDGSTDNTLNYLEKISKRYKNITFKTYSKNRGKGHAVKLGVFAAKGRYIGYTDADFAIDLRAIHEAFKKFDDGADIVIGDRNANSSKIKRPPSFIRKALGRILSFPNNFFLSLDNISDTQCGFKFFKREVAKKLFQLLSLHKWMFDAELLTLAKRQSLKIEKIPVFWEDVKESKVSLTKDLPSVIYELMVVYLKFLNLRIFFLILIALLLILLTPFIVKPTELTLRNGDFSDLTRPNLVFIKNSISKYNQIPLWNPMQFSGLPEIASPISPILYPPYIILLILPLDIGLVLLILLHALLAAYFLFLISEDIFRWSEASLLGLVFIFVFSPFIWGKVAVGHIGHAFAIFLLPPIIYFGFKIFNKFRITTFILLALFLSLQYLNYPTIWFYSSFIGLLFILILSVINRSISKIFVFFAATIASIIFIFPIFLMQYLAGSYVTRTQLRFEDLAIPIWSIKRFLISLMVPPNMTGENETEVWLYISVVAILTAFLGLKKLRLNLWLPVAVIVFLTILITLGSRTPIFGLLVQYVPGFSFLRVTTRIWFILIPIIALLAAYFINIMKIHKFGHLILLAIFIDVFLFSALRLWFVPEQMKTGYGENIQNLVTEKDNLFRYYCTSRCISWGLTADKEINTADGYHPLILRSYQKSISNAGNFVEPRFTGIIPGYNEIGHQPSAEKMGKLSVKWVVSQYRLEDTNFREIGSQGGYKLYENTLAQPRVRFVDSSGKSVLVIDSPNYIKINTIAAQSTKLVLADTYYPGWEARVDKEITDIGIYDGWARSVEVPAGEHTVEFEFKPFNFYENSNFK